MFSTLPPLYHACIIRHADVQSGCRKDIICKFIKTRKTKINPSFKLEILNVKHPRVRFLQFPTHVVNQLISGRVEVTTQIVSPFSS